MDKEWLSADNAGVLYLAYSEGRFACQSPAPDPLGLNYLTGSQGWSLKLTKSFDDGATWTTPTMIWDDYGLGAIPRIAPDGTLYVAFWATTLVPGRVCPPGVYSALGAALLKSNGPFDAIVVATSHDGGQTWGYHQEGQCTHILGSVTKNVSYLGGGFQPGASVDASTGVAYLVYPDFLVEQNRFTLKVISSADDGATWRAPVELTPGTDDSQQPAIHAANGVVRIAYAITRDSDRTGDAAYTESIDRGATWTAPLFLTSEPWQIPREPGSVTDLGDYHGLDLAGGRIVAVWTDARNGSPTEIWSRTGTVP